LRPSGTSRRIATKSAVVLSQARGNGVYENFSEATFPAVRTETGDHLPLLRVLEGLPEHPQPDGITPFATIHYRRGPVARPRFRKIARRVS
jgi:hypothetical protein